MISPGPFCKDRVLSADEPRTITAHHTRLSALKRPIRRDRIERRGFHGR